MLLCVGCAPALLSVKGVPTAQLQPLAPPAPCAAAAPAAHPKLAPIHFEACRGFAACFTKPEFDSLISEIGELKKESGR